MQEETIWPGVRYDHAAGAFPLSTDAFALAGFAAPPHKGQVADLGCACGIVGLLLAARFPQLHITGVEIHEAAAQMAAENAARNGMEARFQAVNGDLRNIRTLLPAGTFQYVVSNPPYFPAGSGALAPEAQRRAARSEEGCTLTQLCDAARWLVQFGGGFALVHKPERLADLCCALRAAGFEPKRMQLVTHRPGKAPSLVLLESRRGGKPGLRMEPELLLYDEQGCPTAAHQRLYGRHLPCVSSESRPN